MKGKIHQRLNYWANRKITKPTKVNFRKDGEIKCYTKSKKTCRHRWRVGAFIGNVKNGRIIKEGIHIWCERCSKKIKAYYKSK